MRQTETGSYAPQLAFERPSVENGAWRVNPDGSMDVTWKLRLNVRWHDGMPFTSEDMLFMFNLRKDPSVGSTPSGGGRPDLMESATAPDPLTFVVHWSQVYVRAEEAAGLEPLPRHLLKPLYRSGVESLVLSPYFRTDFIGLGPYRLVRWEQGSYIEFTRFDAYYQGRPALDSVIVRFVSDPNAMVASILAEAVDVILPTGVELEAALEVKRRWEGTGNEVNAYPDGGLEQLELQHRPEYARPRGGFTVRTVLQAFYHAIDRPTLAEAMTQGLAPVADSWYAPNDPVRKDVEAYIPLFPYDLARAQQLLEQASWTRGSDGALIHRMTGERFEIEIQARQLTGIDKYLNVIADGWKTIGAQVGFEILAPALASDREHGATRPGPLITNPSGANFYDRRLHSLYITSAANRWSGSNRGGYNNPRVDAILDRLAVTIDPRERIPLHRDLLQEQMIDIAVMPLFSTVVPILKLKGIKGPALAGRNGTPNIFEWDRGS